MANEILDKDGMILGPGSDLDEIVAPPSKLDGITEFDYVEVFNPLSGDYPAKVAVSKSTKVPFKVDAPTTGVQNESDIANKYGLSMRNADHPSLQHVAQKVVLKSGKITRLPGNEARVVVSQLVNEILQREGKRNALADPVQRRSVEDRVIQKVGSIQDFMDQAPQTVREQLNTALERADEQDQGVAAEVDTVGQSDRRGPGRPKKTETD